MPVSRNVRESRAVAIWLASAPDGRSQKVRDGIRRGDDAWSLLTAAEKEDAISKYLVRFPGDTDAVAR